MVSLKFTCYSHVESYIDFFLILYTYGSPICLYSIDLSFSVQLKKQKVNHTLFRILKHSRFHEVL